MDDLSTAEAKAWMTKAWRDLETARRAVAGEPPFYDVAVYHCQQAAEKAVKAFLICHAKPYEKTHDLEVLVDLASEVDATFSRELPGAIFSLLDVEIGERKTGNDQTSPRICAPDGGKGVQEKIDSLVARQRAEEEHDLSLGGKIQTLPQGGAAQRRITQLIEYQLVSMGYRRDAVGRQVEG